MEKYGCIYKITNNLNNKVYIGKFVYSDKRSFKHYWGSGIAINRAYKKYGKENFVKEIIEEIQGDNSILCEREVYWISEYNSIDNEIGYNISEGGDGANYWHIEKYREAARDRALNTKNPMHEANRCRKHTKEETAKQNASRAERRKRGEYKKPTITEEHKKLLCKQQQHMVECNKKNGVYDKIAELNRSEEKIAKQRATMKKKGAPHLAKTFIFENIETGEKVEVYGGFMDFCDSHGLSRKCMRNIADGKRKEAYNNWIVSRKNK